MAPVPIVAQRSAPEHAGGSCVAGMLAPAMAPVITAQSASAVQARPVFHMRRRASTVDVLLVPAMAFLMGFSLRSGKGGGTSSRGR